MTQTKQQQKQQ